jgi:ribosome maturation factor RimP
MNWRFARQDGVWRSGPGAHFLFVRKKFSGPVLTGSETGARKMSTRVDTIKDLVEPVLEALGLSLWGIEYLGQGKRSMLRIYIDKTDGVDIEDCAEASRQISLLLDVEDPISTEYTLEVSSPGLDRMLFTIEQYRLYLLSEVKLRLRENLEGRRNYKGKLLAADAAAGTVNVEVDGRELVIPFALIEKGNVVAADV